MLKGIWGAVGLTPHQRHSGKSVRDAARLSKLGNRAVRKARYVPALPAMRHNPILRIFADRLRQRGKPPMLIVAAVRRQLIHLAYGVLKHRQPFDPTYIPLEAVA